MWKTQLAVFFYNSLAPAPLPATPRDCRFNQGGCEHDCEASWNGLGRCICNPGYNLADDHISCLGELFILIGICSKMVCSYIVTPFTKSKSMDYINPRTPGGGGGIFPILFSFAVF